MPRYEYKVVPAPQKGLKGKGVKGAEARFAHALQELMNGLAGYGWEYQRAETLPSLERSGLTSTTTEWRNVLVFRRLREHDAEIFAPELLPPPEAVGDEPGTAGSETAETKINTQEDIDDADGDAEPAAAEKINATDFDNGVEDTDDVEGIGSTLEKLAATRKTDKTTD
ncbi:hypothetical protein Z945_2465 [Sulfitobacter noctilucae]|uniref:hypothetical protein n=1 Tax=Sulfitobacter noctilucae TaxID=1342302 RepID=UPI00046915A4|nr:hypothetical protein [Sulfitobacter noctilucae]KIN61473.1 hypothetical protein Z945_2465 [Sulfitobacter noctilucae]